MLISIVIPSRDRAKYLKYSLQTALAISDQNLEILVSDNASEDNTKELVKSFSDSRLRYINTGTRISMRANFEFALKASRGDYLIFFGDDDGILPGQFPALRHFLEEYKPDGVTWNPLSYGWPTKGSNRKSGGIRFERNMLFGAVCVSSPQECIKTLMKADTERENILPKLYHGCMSRKYLDRLANSDGVYFCGRSPDIYISFRATQLGGNFLRIDHPFSINGYSPASTGGNMVSMGTNQKDVNKDFRFLKECQNDIIDDVIPITKSMSFAYLSAVETVRSFFPENKMSPDYVLWYARAFRDASKKDSTTSKEIISDITVYAKKTGTEAQLKEARTTRKLAVRKLKKLFKKLYSKMFSFRIRAELDGENTILTAQMASDMILGRDIDLLLEKKYSRSAAWKMAKARRKELEGRILD